MTSGPERFLFAPELHGRLAWLVRLRWWPVAGLALASVVGPLFGFAAWARLVWVAASIAAYNVYFMLRLRRALSADSSFEQLQTCAVRQMIMDIAALLATVHFTGGMASPLLPFFVFHMAIGTIMIAGGRMYLVAFGTCASALALFLAEARGLLPQYPLGEGVSWPVSGVILLVLVMTVFGTVYLTDSVASRFKRRTLDLHLATLELEDKTAELERLLGERAALEQRKSKFMLLSAHQLRSPLATVKTSLEVVRRGIVDPGSDRGRRLIAGAVERTDGLLAIVNDLLELAKLREGRARAPWASDVSLNQVVVDVLDALGTVAEARDVAVEADVAQRVVLERAVPPDLVYAVENVVENAIKYSRPGGVVRVALAVEGEHGVLEVSDQGIGIPQEMLEDVLLEFVRAPSARRHAEAGTGLGLAIVREAVEAHGGRVEIRSEDGVGTVVRLFLPRSGVGHVTHG